MGFVLPAAIGAKDGDARQEVVAVNWRGGFQMTIQIRTIFQTKVRLKS
jgi:thiamine pyrophosphate-dependent acetolactate synthase large subunit-like protein